MMKILPSSYRKFLAFCFFAVLAVSAKASETVTIDFTSADVLTQMGINIPAVGEATELSSETSYTYNGITLTKNSGKVRIYNSSGSLSLRISSTAAITLTSESGKMTKIVFSGSNLLYNQKVAAFSASTGTVTETGKQWAGSTNTLTLTSVVSVVVALDSMKITLADDAGTSDGLTFQKDGAKVTAVDVAKGETLTSVSLVSSSDGAISVASSDESVATATLDDDGTLTICGVAIGSATLTATQAATNTAPADTATLSVNVTSGGLQFVLTNEIVEGRTYIIVCQKEKKVVNLTDSNTSKYLNSSDVILSTNADTATITADDRVNLAITIEACNGGYTLRNAASGLYIYQTQKNNSLLFTTNADTAKAAPWTIAFDANKIATITCAYGYVLKFSGATTNYFGVYKSTSTKYDVYLYMSADAEYAEVTVGSLGYATLYYGTKNLLVPEEVTVSTLKNEFEKVSEGNYEIALNTYQPGSIILAGTAVIVKAEPGTYRFMIVARDEDCTEIESDGLLCGVDVDSTLNAPDGQYVYGLNYISVEGAKTPGFYWQKGTGGTYVNLKAHKACLFLDKDRLLGTRRRSIGDGWKME